jgi:hypothetical protein
MATVTLTARDAYDNPEPTSGLAVAFGLGTGSGAGTFGPVTDNRNGISSATFTAPAAGSNTSGLCAFPRWRFGLVSPRFSARRSVVAVAVAWNRVTRYNQGDFANRHGRNQS